MLCTIRKNTYLSRMLAEKPKAITLVRAAFVGATGLSQTEFESNPQAALMVGTVALAALEDSASILTIDQGYASTIEASLEEVCQRNAIARIARVQGGERTNPILVDENLGGKVLDAFRQTRLLVPQFGDTGFASITDGAFSPFGALKHGTPERQTQLLWVRGIAENVSQALEALL